ASFDTDVAAVGPTELCHPLKERRVAGLTFRIVRGRGVQHADAPHALARLRARRDRPRSRTAEQRDEMAAAAHSITSSASASSLSGIWRPSALAVLRLMASSNFVGC